MNNIQRGEYNYLKKVILRLKKAPWDKDDFIYIKGLFDSFCLKNELDKISALRYGEVFLGKIVSEYNLKDYDSSRSLIYYCINNMDSLEIPTIAVCIGAIAYIVLEEDKNIEED